MLYKYKYSDLFLSCLNRCRVCLRFPPRIYIPCHHATSRTCAVSRRPPPRPSAFRFASSQGDNMVLQRAPAQATVWGFVEPGKAVQVHFNGQTIAATTRCATLLQPPRRFTRRCCWDCQHVIHPARRPCPSSIVSRCGGSPHLLFYAETHTSAILMTSYVITNQHLAQPIDVDRKAAGNEVLAHRAVQHHRQL